MSVTRKISCVRTNLLLRSPRQGDSLPLSPSPHRSPRLAQSRRYQVLHRDSDSHEMSYIGVGEHFHLQNIQKGQGEKEKRMNECKRDNFTFLVRQPFLIFSPGSKIFSWR